MPKTNKVKEEIQKIIETEAPETAKELKKTASRAKKAMKKAEEVIGAEVTAAQNMIDEAIAAPEAQELIEQGRKAAVSTAKKAARAAEKVTKAAKKAVPQIVLQFGGQEYTEEKLVKTAKDVWQYDLGKDVKDIKKLAIYIKPEEGKAYVVVNDKEALNFNI